MHYTEKFQRILDRVPRVDERGRDIPENTRRNMAISIWQRVEVDKTARFEPIHGQLVLVERIDK